MKLLLDTHILLWAASDDKRLSTTSRAWIENPEHQLFFSAASLWEIVIKSSLDRADFQVDARQLQQGLLENGYQALAIQPAHTLGIQHLPSLHKDPFDRLLISQAIEENLTLITADTQIAQYSGPIQLV